MDEKENPTLLVIGRAVLGAIVGLALGLKVMILVVVLLSPWLATKAEGTTLAFHLGGLFASAAVGAMIGGRSGYREFVKPLPPGEDVRDRERDGQ